jgi:hypothetical protein
MFFLMEETETATENTDLDKTGPNGWSIHDEVTQLRERGASTAYPLPPRHVIWTIGASRDCSLRLWDPSGGLSRVHAVLTYGMNGKDGWVLDGARVPMLAVVPGAEIRLGGITLIAESPQLIALRALLERLIGWADERREVVDQSLFSLRISATCAEPLLLCGEGNLVPIARLLHHRAIGKDRPFVVARQYRQGVDALAEATGGTLCVWRHDQPDDLDEIVARRSYAKSLFVVCAHMPPMGNDVASRIITPIRSIMLPPLSHRPHELHRIIDAFAQDAVAAFGGGGLTAADWEWIERNASSSLHLIAMATRRIIALHLCNENVTPAAKLLSMAHSSLSDWLARRSLPGPGKIDISDGSDWASEDSETI